MVRASYSMETLGKGSLEKELLWGRGKRDEKTPSERMENTLEASWFL